MKSREHDVHDLVAAPGCLILLSGERGVGKSTVCLRLVQRWRERGGRPAGLVTRTDGPRRLLMDVATGEERTLAADGTELPGPRWGRFSFSQETLDWGNRVLRAAAAGPADLLFLDEVGPLELTAGGGLLGGLLLLLRSEPGAVVVVRPALIEQLQALTTGRTVLCYQVTPENRDRLPGQIARRAAR